MIQWQTAAKQELTQHPDAFFHRLPLIRKTASSGMYVTGGGRRVIRAGEKYPPNGLPALYHFDWSRGRTLPEFQTLLVADGAGIFESQPTGCLELEGPSLIFLFPGVWHRFRPSPGVGWTERWISFNGTLVHELFGIGSFGPSLSLSKPLDPDRLTADFDFVLERIRCHFLQDPAVLTYHLLHIIGESVAQRLGDAHYTGAPGSFNAVPSVDDPVVQKALEIIWSRGQYPMSVEDIARQLPVTRRTLDRRFVDATGHSVLDEINVCRLSRAKQLLVSTDQPVKTVAHLAGFSSTERMRVLFVEREGKSPSEYRKAASQCGHLQNGNRLG